MANRISTLFEFKEQGRGLSKIKSDIQGVDGAWNKARTGFKSAVNEFRSSNAAQGAAIAGLGAGALKAIGYASDLEESVNAVTVSYGDNAEAVLAIGENAAESFGLSKTEFNNFSVQFSAFAKQVAEKDGRQVSEVIEEMTGRVADFASVMNLDVNTAAQVFMSTMAGETEPIRRFGKDVSAAAVETYALANGLAESKSEIDESIKVQARYGLLMEQTADTAGDFANTSDSLANSQRILAADAKDLAAEMGTTLAPALATVVTGLTEILGVLDQLKITDAISLSWVEDLGTDIGQFFNALAFGDGAHEARKFADSVNNAETAVKGFDKSLLDGAESATEVRKRASEFTSTLEGNVDQLHATNMIVAEWHKETVLAAEAQEEAERAALLHTEAQRDQAKAAEHTATTLGGLKSAEEELEEQVERTAEAQRKNAERTDQAREAHRKLVDEILGSMESLFSHEQSVLRTRNAYLDYETALEENMKTQADSKASDREKAESANNLRIKELELADQVRATAESYAEEQGAVEGSKEWADLMRDALEQQAGEYPHLRDEIDLLIGKLNEIPTMIHTGVTITYTENGRPKTIKAGPGTGTISTSGKRAHGGPTDAGGLYEVTEGGKSELLHEGGKTYLMAGRDGRVEPVDSGGQKWGGVGVAPPNVTLNIQPGAIVVNGNTSPEAVVDAFSQFVRRNGPGQIKRQLGI